MEAMIEAAGNIGFPALLCIILIIYNHADKKSFTKAVNEMTIAIKCLTFALKDKGVEVDEEKIAELNGIDNGQVPIPNKNDLLGLSEDPS